jgi:hypothetical protein
LHSWNYFAWNTQHAVDQPLTIIDKCTAWKGRFIEGISGTRFSGFNLYFDIFSLEFSLKQHTSWTEQSKHPKMHLETIKVYLQCVSRHLPIWNESLWWQDKIWVFKSLPRWKRILSWCITTYTNVHCNVDAVYVVATKSISNSVPNWIIDVQEIGAI